jgi:hypothetical protein
MVAGVAGASDDDGAVNILFCALQPVMITSATNAAAGADRNLNIIIVLNRYAFHGHCQLQSMIMEMLYTRNMILKCTVEGQAGSRQFKKLKSF